MCLQRLSPHTPHSRGCDEVDQICAVYFYIGNKPPKQWFDCDVHQHLVAMLQEHQTSKCLTVWVQVHGWTCHVTLRLSLFPATSACRQLEFLTKPSTPQRCVYSVILSARTPLNCHLRSFSLTQLQESVNVKEWLDAGESMKRHFVSYFFERWHADDASLCHSTADSDFCCDLRCVEQSASRCIRTLDDARLLTRAAAQMLHSCPFTLPHIHPLLAL